MFEFRTIPVPARRPQPRVGVCIVTRSGRERYLKRTLAGLRRQPVDILLWANGPIDLSQLGGCDSFVYCHQHAFNVGQHVAHNEMLDWMAAHNYDWHIRVDDDCFISTRKWLTRLLDVQENIRKLSGKYCVLGIKVAGLDNEPPTIHAYELGREIVEQVEILGGIFRMTPMPVIRYFRWDERQAMGFGDATQFRSFCESTGTHMLRVQRIKATHGESTQTQNMSDPTWTHEHDMLQYIPLGL